MQEHPTRKDSTDSAIELFEVAAKMGKSKGSKKNKEEKKDAKKDKKDKKTEVIVDEPDEDYLAEEDGVTDVRDLCPFLGGGCFITSFYMLWPQCFGLYGNMTVGCFEIEYKACKISARPTDWCILLNLGCLFVAPKTCLKSVCQCCCIDGRCAIPCHAEMPCLLNACGVNCVYQYGCSCHCCKSIGYLAEVRELEEQNMDRSEKN